MIDNKFKVLILGYPGVGKSTFINSIELDEKAGQIKQIDNETSVIYAVDQDDNKVYELELIEYSMGRNSSVLGSYF